MRIDRKIADYTRQNPVIIVLVMLVMCIATVTVIAVAYRHNQHVNDRRFCGVIRVFTMPESQPQTPRSIEINQAMQDLAARLGCPHE